MTGDGPVFHDGNWTSDLRVDASTIASAELIALGHKGYGRDSNGNITPLARPGTPTTGSVTNARIGRLA